MNIFNVVKDAVLDAVSKAYPDMQSVPTITVEPPKEVSHGDISTNVAMVLAGQLKQNPRQVASVIIEQLSSFDWIADCTIAGPGFINLTMKPDCWYRIILHINQMQDAYGTSTVGSDDVVNVEYVSANPTGPMHIGHARGAVYGDALARLLQKAGFKVTKEYYINDAGSQINTLARSAYLRYLEALGQTIEIPAGLYPGEYLKPVGEALKHQFGDALQKQDESQRLAIVRELAVEQMLLLIKRDLSDLGVVHDVFISEKKLHDAKKIEEAIALLQDKSLLYHGILESPKGKTPDDWEPREQLLFQATAFGDDVDRAIQKSDGSYTYFAADIAYHLDKIRRGFNKMVLVLGADHGGYTKRLKAVVNALSDNKASVEVKLSQLVNFVENGQPIKMSKRKGSFTTVNDVVGEVGADVVRFIMLTRKNDVVLDFDLKLVKEQSKDNPVFYVQYAHARCCSVLRLAQEHKPQALALSKSLSESDLAVLTDESELGLIKLLATWPRIVEASALAYEPHRIAFFVQEVAASFHALWNKGKDHVMLRFMVEGDDTLTAARLALVQATAHVIASALGVIGVKPVQIME